MLKLIILDFDGVIIDTENEWYKIYKNWFKQNKNYELQIDEFLACVGSNSEKLFNLLEKKGIYVEQNQFDKDTLESFRESAKELPLKGGVKKFIKLIKEKGLYLALATSSDFEKVSFHLTRLGILKYFDVIVSADDVDRIKPFPDLFLKTAERCGCNFVECLVVEDSLNGLKAGLNANMKVLIVPNDITQYCKFENYYMMANSLEEVNLEFLINDFKKRRNNVAESH